MSKKVSLEIKIRDAATTLSDVKASHKKVSKQTEKQLDVANKRVEAAQKDLWRISEQVNQVQKKLLEHRAGVLSASQVRNTEEKMNSPSNHHTYMSPMDSKVASPLSTMNSSFTLPQKRSFNDTRETINTFWREIPRLEKLDAEVEQLLKDREALDGESKEPGKQLEVLQARLASLEFQAAAEIVGGNGFTELRAQLKGKRQGSHLDRTFDDNDIHELRQLQDEMGYLRLEDKAALDKANHELNAATTALGDIIKEHGITLYSRDEGLPGMLKRVRMYFAGLHNKLEAHAKEAIEWDGMRKRFEDNEQSHLEEREALMRELESVRNQLETAKAEKMTMQSKQTKLADTISALHSSAIGSLPHNQDSAPHSDSDISKDVSILLSTWDILPSPAARAAIYYASYSDRDEFYPMPSESVTHLPDSGLCFLKVLYNKQENPDWHEPRNDTFTVKALSDRVQVMLKDVRALIEKLERVTRSSKPPSKDFERAQKLLKERELTIEAQQRQVKMLEERNISFAARQAEMQEEIQRLQDDIEHATEGKQEAKMLDTEPGETAVNIALERRGSQLSKYRDELQVAHGEVDTVKNSNQPQGTSWLDYHDAAQTRNNALGTPTNTSGKK
ncbi:hypothetical protein BDQ17DRAFT_1430572 [Cyathus striatus]|nr:hypothetical protein BDQ17DRAFT_1430572 [Cyathus striatus]